MFQSRTFRRVTALAVTITLATGGLAATAAAAPIPPGLSYGQVVQADQPIRYFPMNDLGACAQLVAPFDHPIDPSDVLGCPAGGLAVSRATVVTGALASGTVGTSLNRSLQFEGTVNSWASVFKNYVFDDNTLNGTSGGPITFSTYHPYAVEAWVQTTHPAGAVQPRVFSMGDSEILAIDEQGHPYAEFKTTTGTVRITGPTSLLDGAWHHLAIRFDNLVDASLLVDGATVASSALAQLVPTTYAPDSSSPNSYLTQDIISVGWGFNGSIDELAFYTTEQEPTLASLAARYGYGSTTRASYMQQVIDDHAGWYSAMDGVDNVCICLGPVGSSLIYNRITSGSGSGDQFTWAHTTAAAGSDVPGVLDPSVVGASTNRAVPFGGTDNSWAFISDVTGYQGDPGSGILGSLSASERDTVFATGALTVEAWVKTTQTLTDPVVGRRHVARAGGYDFFIDETGHPSVELRTAAGLVSHTEPVVVNDGQWRHLAFTWDGASLEIVVDGVSTGSFTIPPTTLVYNSTDAASIGWGLAGSVDEVAVYPTALPITRLRAHHDYVVPTAAAYYQVPVFSFDGVRPSQVTANDPVDTASGNFLHSETDLTGDGYGLALARTYNSRDTRTSPLGVGWSMSYGDRLDPTSAAVLYTDATGRQVSYTANPDGSYTRPADVTANLARNVDGSWTLTWFNGDIYTFTPAGLLAGSRSTTGQSVTITRDLAGRVRSVGNPIGNSFTYAYNPDGMLASVIGSDGRTVTYGYLAGRLASVTLPDGKVWTYQFTPGGFLGSVTDPAGIVVVANTYDTQGRVATQQLGSQAAMVFFTFNDTTGDTTTWNASTNEHLTYHHDRQGRVTSITDPAGNNVTRTYDMNGRLASATDRAGAVTIEVRDANANVVSSTVPGEGTSSYTYDSSNRILTATDPFGATTSFTYTGTERFPATVKDPLGNVTSNVVAGGLVSKTTDPDGVARTFTYNAKRQLTSVADGLGRTTSYTYDLHGWRTATSNPAGGVASTSYDNAGRVLTQTDDAGAVSANTYDPAGRLTAVTDPTGAKTTYGYDTRGRPASITAPDGTMTTTGFDDLGRATSSTQAGASISTTTYGTLSRVSATADPVGRTSTYSYDASGRQTSMTAPDGGVSSTSYNTAGQTTGSSDPTGRASTTTYDSKGRVASSTAPGGLTAAYRYDTLNRVTAATAPDGGITATTYTPGGRTATVTDPTGRKLTYGYDPAGQLVTMTDPSGAVTRFGYDALGRRTTVTDPTGLVTTTAYDAVGNVVSVRDPSGVTVRSTWSKRHQKLTEQVDGQGTVTNTYNPVGTLATVTDPLGRKTSYDYDVRRNRISRTDVTGAVERWEYNLGDQVTARVDPPGRRTTYTYDPAGRIATMTDPSARTTTNTYDPAGRVTTRVSTGGGGAAVTVTYTYDPAGRRASMTDPTGTTTYAYDQASRLTAIARTVGGTIRYGYDSAGRRTTITYPDNTVATSTYDPVGRLATVTYPGAGTIRYTYDLAGRPLTTSGLPGGVTRTTGYTAGRPTSYTDTDRSTTIGYDTTGRIATMTGADPASFGYDPASELTSATTNGVAQTYSYDQTGGIATATVAGVATNYTRDTAKQLTKTVTGTQTTNIVSDGAGRITTETGTDGTTTTTSYDARGLPVRIERTTPIPAPVIPYPQPTSPIVVPIVVPIFECAVKQANGKWSAYFGYDNDSFELFRRVGVSIPKGPLNRLLGPGIATATLPDKFGVPGIVVGDPGRTPPGRQNPKAFIATDWDGKTLSWQLGLLLAVATTTKLCTDTPPATTQTTVEQRTYDGDGNLAAITTTNPAGATTTNTVAWDTSRAIPQVLASSSAGVATDYLYGQHRETITNGSTTSPYSYNAFGDTITTTATVGSSIAGGYDPWGNPQTNPQTGTGIRFGYRNELTIADRVDLRARDYRPGLRQFTTTDPLDGVNGTATVADPYHYTNNDPTNLTDPLGLRPSDQAVADPDTDREAHRATTASTRGSLDAAISAYLVNTARGLGAFGIAQQTIEQLVHDFATHPDFAELEAIAEAVLADEATTASVVATSEVAGVIAAAAIPGILLGLLIYHLNPLGYQGTLEQAGFFLGDHVPGLDAYEQALEGFGSSIIDAVPIVGTIEQNAERGVSGLWNTVSGLVSGDDPKPQPSTSGAGASSGGNDCAINNIRSILDSLPKGKQSDVRIVGSDAELKALFDMFSAGGVPISRPTYDGEWYELEDGCQVGIRNASKSGGRTIDIRSPSGRTWRVHIT